MNKKYDENKLKLEEEYLKKQREEQDAREKEVSELKEELKTTMELLKTQQEQSPSNISYKLIEETRAASYKQGQEDTQKEKQKEINKWEKLQAETKTKLTETQNKLKSSNVLSVVRII